MSGEGSNDFLELPVGDLGPEDGFAVYRQMFGPCGNDARFEERVVAPSGSRLRQGYETQLRRGALAGAVFATWLRLAVTPRTEVSMERARFFASALIF